MSLNGGEHVVLAEVHSPEMQLDVPEKEYETTELHKVSTTVQSREVLERATADNPTPSEEPQLGQRVRKLTETEQTLDERVIEEILSVASGKTVISSHRSRCSAASRKSAAAETPKLL